MRICIKCKVSGDEASFYTNNGLCKCCIDSIREKRMEKIRNGAEQAQRDLDSVLAVVMNLHEIFPSFVYLLEADRAYKIGFSSNVGKRIRAINIGRSIPCRLVAVAPGGRQQENALHKKFATSKISREWFKHSPRILKVFSQLDDAVVFLPGWLAKNPLATGTFPALS